MKLVRLVCVAKAHANGHSDSALTIRDGSWAFCSQGADAVGHEWSPTDGLPIMEAMRFPPRQPSAAPPRPTVAAAAPAPDKPKGKARSR
jgi:hypothetical protein